MQMNTFFRSSRYIFNEITALFDFLWPTAAAMWNLRWQVNGYLQVRPDASDRELLNRFTMGSNIHGANLKHACVNLTWEEQQKKFAKFLLVNIISLYESYLSLVIQELDLSLSNKKKKDIKANLQFPTSENEGVWNAIKDITTPESDLMKIGFYPILLKNKRNYKSNLDNLMICYRYFKECRNSFAHAGSIADDKVLDAYSNFNVIATKVNLGVSEVPEYFPVVAGQPVHISLRGVVGLCDIILKIIVTLDAEFSRSKYTEIVFKKYWNEINGRKYTLKTSDKNKRERQIEKLINKLGLPTPESIDGFEFFLRDNGMVG
jgi:hypothetical protein